MQKHFKVTVDPEQCKGCERCVIACPKAVIKLGNKLNLMGYPYVQIINDKCVGCGSCFYQCPEPGAITISETGEHNGVQ